MDTEKLFDNFEKYTSLLKKYFPDEGINSFLDDFGVRVTTSPRGLTKEDGGSPGSLIEFLLKTALIANDHYKVYSSKCSDPVDRKSLMRVCLVHEIGRAGSKDHDLYIPQESQWHREKLGQMFKYNEDCPKMSVSHRTLSLLQAYQISLNDDEWLAILTSQGMHYPENAFYGNSLSDLSKILHFSRSLAT